MSPSVTACVRVCSLCARVRVQSVRVQSVRVCKCAACVLQLVLCEFVCIIRQINKALFKVFASLPLFFAATRTRLHSIRPQHSQFSLCTSVPGHCSLSLPLSIALTLLLIASCSSCSLASSFHDRHTFTSFHFRQLPPSLPTLSLSPAFTFTAAAFVN